MTKKYADIRITLTVEFEDNGEDDLIDQAIEACLDNLATQDAELEVIGEVRDTEQLNGR